MVLNIDKLIAQLLLKRAVMPAIAKLKEEEEAALTQAHRTRFEDARCMLEIVRHRLEYGLGYEPYFTSPKNVARYAAIKARLAKPKE